MRFKLKLWMTAFVLAAVTNAHAADVPTTITNDPRIRFVTYKPNEVTAVRVQRGVVTRIILEADEKIEVPVVGLSSECTRDADEWCISAILGANQIFVRPRDAARRNNMELRTNKRDYSFVFDVASEIMSYGKRVGAEQAYFRLVFDYPQATPVAAVASVVTERDRAAAVNSLLRRVEISSGRAVPQNVDSDFGMTPGQRLKAEGVVLRNVNYSKQVLAKGEDADPTMVFDDGRFTYFEFPGAREIPAVFAYGSDNEATRVNWHMNGNFVVVQRTARKFTLRIGDAVVGIFNESFDPTGIETPTATVSPAVKREIKGATP